MKISVSLPEDDVALLDAYAERAGHASRSAALHAVLQTVRHPTLEDDYAAAWEAWTRSGEAQAWDVTVADGGYEHDAPR